MTDRSIVYPGELPRTLDSLSPQQWLGIAIGYLARAAIGTSTWVDGLACTPTAPASMQVIVEPGSIGTLTIVEQTAYGGVAADTADPLVKVGINITTNIFTITAPATVGQSQNYLIAGEFSETDAVPIVLPYYNAANPQQPYQGPANSGAPQNTQRIQRVALQLVAGVPAATGSQTTPATPSGYVPLWVITVAQGQTTITAGDISQAPGAPFIVRKLMPQGTPTEVSFTTAGGFSSTVPAGLFKARIRLWGAGGGGRQASGAGAATGGGGGGYLEKTLAVTPGQVISGSVGAGGSPGAPGTNGGNTTISSLGLTAGGGLTGVTNGSTFTGGAASGGDLNLLGGTGSIRIIWLSTESLSGEGGSSYGFGKGFPAYGSAAAVNNGIPGTSPGQGGGGGANGGSGESGADGLAVIEYS